MKQTRIKIAGRLLALLALVFFAGCHAGTMTGAPPVSIPAPTGGYINQTASDSEGKALLYGYIYNSDDAAVVPDATVTVTNATTGDSVTTTTDSNGYFAIRITALVGHVIQIKYTDPETSTESEETSTTITNETQPMTSTTMIPYDVDLDSTDGFAVMVANDGTNSEIVEIDLSTGAVQTRATFTDKLFDKIAVHGSIDYAAVLDTSNRYLYWYDLANLDDDMTADYSTQFSSDNTPRDLAIGDVDDTETADPADPNKTTYDFVVVTHDYTDYSFIAIYEIVASGDDWTLDTPSSDNCLVHPDDTYGTCHATLSDYPPTRATSISVTNVTTTLPRLAINVEYNDGGTTIRATHFAYVYQDTAIGYVNIRLNPTPTSRALESTDDPYDLAWYNEGTIAFITDSTNGNFIMLKDESGTINRDVLTVGNTLMGIYVDEDNTRAFVADQSADAVINIDIPNFQLSGTSYTGNYDPTKLVYYTDGSTEKIGVILTSPEPLFKTIDITE